jgi:type IV secretion system protein VirB1
MELMGCQDLAVPAEVMQHVVRVESSFNPYAIGVVGGRLVRQPKTLPEALATVRMLERRGYNFSVGLAQVNRKNLDKYGLDSYEKAFQACPNLQAGSRILAECYSRSKGSWPKSFSCYYSGDFTTGFRHGYVQKIYTSIRAAGPAPSDQALAIDVVDRRKAGVGGSAAVPARKEMRRDAARIASAWPANARVLDPAPVPAATGDPPSVPVRVTLAGQMAATTGSGSPSSPPSMAGALHANAPATTNTRMQDSVDAAFVF